MPQCRIRSEPAKRKESAEGRMVRCLFSCLFSVAPSPVSDPCAARLKSQPWREALCRFPIFSLIKAPTKRCPHDSQTRLARRSRNQDRAWRTETGEWKDALAPPLSHRMEEGGLRPGEGRPEKFARPAHTSSWIAVLISPPPGRLPASNPASTPLFISARNRRPDRVS